MRRMLIETKYAGKLNLPDSLIQKLPSTVVLALPVQFLDFRELVKKQLAAAGKKVILFQSQHGKHPGQILGCDIFEVKGDYDAFLYVGDGQFHPTALLYRNRKKVFCYNPFTDRTEILAEDYLLKLEQKRKGQLNKFFSSEKVGIIINTKPGQNQVKKAEELKEKLDRKGKKAYLFLTDEVNPQQLADFNFIEVWINTACPRLAEDFNCLNLEDLQEIEI